MSSLQRVGIRWNPHHGQSVDVLPRCTLSINITGPESIRYLADGDHYHTCYVIFGHEVGGAGFEYSEAGLRQFLTLHAEYVEALTIRNEWNDWVWGEGGLPVDRVRAENEWGARVCAEFGVPFAISSTLTHDWGGGNNGYGDLLRVYPDLNPPGDFVDVHLYGSNTDVLRRELEGWKDLPIARRYIIGEFGTVHGEDLPVREMFDVLLPYPGIACSCMFCLEDFGDPNKTFGLLRQDGSEKPAFEAFCNYASEHARDIYETGGEPAPMPVTINLTPTTAPKKSTAIIVQPSDQDANVYAVSIYNRPGQTEWSALGSIVKDNVLPALRWLTDVDVYNIVMPKASVSGPELAGLKAAAQAVADFARKYPNTKFLYLNLHTNAGGDYGSLYAGDEAKKLATAINNQFDIIRTDIAKPFIQNGAGEGWIALGQGTVKLPMNVIPVIVEIGRHDNPLGVQWIEEHVDAIGQALRAGVAGYLVGAPPATQPAPVDYKAAYEKLRVALGLIDVDAQSIQQDAEAIREIVKEALG